MYDDGYGDDDHDGDSVAWALFELGAYSKVVAAAEPYDPEAEGGFPLTIGDDALFGTNKTLLMFTTRERAVAYAAKHDLWHVAYSLTPTEAVDLIMSQYPCGVRFVTRDPGGPDEMTAAVADVVRPPGD